jgi:peptidoglycan hydrolase-like protein with peptidoglycan-binding domain
MRAAGRRVRLLAAVTLVVAIGAVIVIVIGSGSPTPSRAASNPGVTGAATVQRRDLVATDTEAGTLSYDGPQTVYDRLTGTVTWLPSVGDVIKPGGTLFRVDGAPVVLLNGSTPAYRTLSAADADGSDITELNRNLAALGFDPDGLVVDDVWQPATTTGVELLQESLGETATGILSLGQVVFLPGDQLISTVDGSVGAGGGSGTGSTDLAVTPPAPEFVSLRSGAATTRATTAPTTTTTSTTTSPATTGTGTSTAPTTTPAPTRPRHKPPRRPSPPTVGERELAALAALLRAESAQLQAATAELRADRAAAGKSSGSGKSSGTGKSSGSSKSSTGSGSPTSSSGAGSGSASGSAILQTTSTHLVVTVDLSASSQSEAKVGERVTVEMPAGNTVGGKITAVSPVAESSSGTGNGGGSGSGGGGSGGGSGNGGSGSSSTIPVTIRLSGHHTGAGLDQAAVSVNFVQQRARNVLSVPVTALVATSGDTYDVQTAATPHRLIPVTTGLFAAGYVQISGPGVSAGLQVTDSQG